MSCKQIKGSWQENSQGINTASFITRHPHSINTASSSKASLRTAHRSGQLIATLQGLSSIQHRAGDQHNT